MRIGADPGTAGPSGSARDVRPPAVLPRALVRGGVIGVCSPAGPISADEIRWGIDWLRGEGFEVICAPHVHARRGYLAGTEDERFGDFAALLRNPEVGAILPTRGGYGCARWLARLSPDELLRARKLVIGHSDMTALALYQLRTCGLASIHGPMLQRGDLTPRARRRVLELACGEAAALEPLRGEGVRGGVAEGRLVGGNLTMVCASLCTPWEIDTDGAILFLEDTAVQPYAIDRLLSQLRAAGTLERVRGVALGQFVHADSSKYPEVTARDVLVSELSTAQAGPIVADLPFGHVADHLALPFGTLARLSGDAGTLTPLASPVDAPAAS
jgi:muramoyltetrapeptide carboxypeptidase